MKDVEFYNISKEMIEQVSKGAFLNTSLNGIDNTMTIGWATFGVIWGKPIAMVAVRYSRHTYPMIEKVNEFIISIPKEGQLKKELGICGTKSGRDVDKFEECKFTKIPGEKVQASIIGECEYHLECKVVYKQAMEPGLLDQDIKERFYNSNNDYHVLYYGEILKSYKKD